MLCHSTNVNGTRALIWLKRKTPEYWFWTFPRSFHIQLLRCHKAVRFRSAGWETRRLCGGALTRRPNWSLAGRRQPARRRRAVAEGTPVFFRIAWPTCSAKNSDNDLTVNETAAPAV